MKGGGPCVGGWKRLGLKVRTRSPEHHVRPIQYLETRGLLAIGFNRIEVKGLDGKGKDELSKEGQNTYQKVRKEGRREGQGKKI